MPVGSVPVQGVSHGHISRKDENSILIMVMDGQLDVVRGDDEAPSLFDLKKNFCFHGTEWHIQLVGLQDFGVCEDSLFFVAMKSWS